MIDVVTGPSISKPFFFTLNPSVSIDDHDTKYILCNIFEFVEIYLIYYALFIFVYVWVCMSLTKKFINREPYHQSFWHCPMKSSKLTNYPTDSD